MRDLGRGRWITGLARTACLVTCILAACLLTGCRSQGLIQPETVTIQAAGATSFTAGLRDLAAAYGARHANVVIEVAGTGSADGLRALAAGEVDLAAISCQPPKASLPAGVEGVPVAHDAVALVVHPSNPIRGLTLLQIKALYAGETLDWRALGGPALEPMLVSREDGSGTRATFEALVMAGERVTLSAIIMPSSQAVVEYVAQHPAAIGYVTTAAIDGRVRTLAVEDVLPEPANIRAGSYHLGRVIYLYHKGNAAQGFVDFALSPAGQAIVGRKYVGVR